MDDRYDHILLNDWAMGDSAQIKYVPASFRIPGNDGNRFNGSVNGTFNASVPVAVANALHEISDHLPVMLKLAIGPALVSSTELSEAVAEPFRFTISPHSPASPSIPSSQWIQFPNSYAEGFCRWEIRDAMGRRMEQGEDAVDALGRIQFREPVMAKGWYTLTVEWQGNARHGSLSGKMRYASQPFWGGH